MSDWTGTRVPANAVQRQRQGRACGGGGRTSFARFIALPLNAARYCSSSHCENVARERARLLPRQHRPHRERRLSHRPRERDIPRTHLLGGVSAKPFSGRIPDMLSNPNKNKGLATADARRDCGLPSTSLALRGVIRIVLRRTDAIRTLTSALGRCSVRTAPGHIGRIVSRDHKRERGT